MNATEPAPYPPTDGTQPCAAEDPEVFFPSTPMQVEFETARALAVCAPCQFRRPCLAYALTHDVRGVWGATSYQQRRRLRAQHGITAVPVQIIDQEDDEELLEQMERLGASAREIAQSLGVTPGAVVRRRARRRQQP